VGIAAVALAAWLWWKRKKEIPAELTVEQVAQQIGIQGAGASMPMTFFMLIALIPGIIMYFLDLFDYAWLLLVPGLPAFYYFSFAIKRGAKLLRLPNYAEAAALYSKNAKHYTTLALEDPWVKKQLRFYSPGLVKLMIKIGTIGLD
jgi:hypothetical protein